MKENICACSFCLFRSRPISCRSSGSPETPTYIEKMMQNHEVDIVGITDTHLIPERRIRTLLLECCSLPPNAGIFGRVSLFFRREEAAILIFKHYERNYQLIIAQVGHFRIGVVYTSPAAIKREKNVLEYDQYPRTWQGSDLRGLELAAEKMRQNF